LAARFFRLAAYGRKPIIRAAMNANAAQIIKVFSGLVSPMRSLLSEKLWAGI
jgi:hypothetical protein